MSGGVRVIRWTWPLGKKPTPTPEQRSYRRRENRRAVIIVAVVGILAAANWGGIAFALAVVVLWMLPIYIASEMGRAKNRSGLAWGILLGWLGVICLAFLPPAEPRPDPSEV